MDHLQASNRRQLFMKSSKIACLRMLCQFKAKKKFSCRNLWLPSLAGVKSQKDKIYSRKAHENLAWEYNYFAEAEY